MDIVFKTEKAVFNYRVAGLWIENGHVLLHRSVNEENWSVPGGRAAINEDSKSSIKREFLEELNVEMKVDRLVWMAENFFNYRGQDFHEIGFYYIVQPIDRAIGYRKEPFYGVEGERLIYQWIPIPELENINLYPEFLRTALKSLPHHTEHLVVSQNQLAN
ncbi:NUDIX hydrolase [Bacillus salacetis]|uniref:NUDIX hydrolase n=1 Tax=Bacillus salacetis TaxID=2315464 RepID=UPI003BA1B268